MEAARAKHLAGAPEAALALAGGRGGGAARRARTGAQSSCSGPRIAFANAAWRGRAAAAAQGGRRLESLDVGARSRHLPGRDLRRDVRRPPRGRLRPAPGGGGGAAPRRRPPGCRRGSDLLLDGLALLLTDGHAAAGADARRRSAPSSVPGASLRTRRSAGCGSPAMLAMDVWDDESHRRAGGSPRRAGAAPPVRSPCFRSRSNTRAGVHIAEGEFADAEALLEEVRAVTRGDGRGARALRRRSCSRPSAGDEADASARLDATLEAVRGRGEGIGVTIAHWAGAVLYNGLGRYQEALASARVASEYPADLRFAVRSHAELIEAASRTGDHEEGREALARLVGDHPRERHRAGARVRGPRPRAARRRGGSRAPLRRGGGAHGPHARADRVGPRPPGLRRMAAARAPPRGRQNPPPRRP